MTSVKLFLDTEFNGFNGELISVALVETGGVNQFYEVLEYSHMTLDPWVAENVIPILNKTPTSLKLVQQRLETFLAKYKSVEVLCDWPEDISHLCRLLITGPGKRMQTPRMTFAFKPSLSAYSAFIRHNALWDAVAIEKDFAAQTKYSGI